MLKLKDLKVSTHLIACTVVLLITLGIYWNSLQGEFIWDDKDLILKHSGYLNDWKNIFSVFTKPFFGETPYYRPFLILSFILDYQLWGPQPFGFHYTNVVLHITNAIMVYMLTFLFCRHVCLSLFSALLFATHVLLTGSQRETIGTFVPLLFHPRMIQNYPLHV
jgi:hypothetical protein